ncbi:MAG: hypothetical protein CMJ64_07835, partial [Planctomycetaceae bacterium]|nr:hypothetical protein [Planctomycetaceae bacterium]
KIWGGGRDVKMARDLGLERFHAQPKWEIPAERVLERLPRASAIIVDQSEPFLGLAERRLERFATRVTLVQARLQDDWSDGLTRQPTSIVSMSAIHHLDPHEKTRLYLQAFDCLDEQGLFVNGDKVRDSDTDKYLTYLQN